MASKSRTVPLENYDVRDTDSRSSDAAKAAAARASYHDRQVNAARATLRAAVPNLQIEPNPSALPPRSSASTRPAAS